MVLPRPMLILDYAPSRSHMYIAGVPLPLLVVLCSCCYDCVSLSTDSFYNRYYVCLSYLPSRVCICVGIPLSVLHRRIVMFIWFLCPAHVPFNYDCLVTGKLSWRHKLRLISCLWLTWAHATCMVFQMCCDGDDAWIVRRM